MQLEVGAQAFEEPVVDMYLSKSQARYKSECASCMSLIFHGDPDKYAV